MTADTEPTRAPSKALYLTDYARSTWDIAALSVSTLILRRFLSTLTIQPPLEAGLRPLPVPATSVYTRLDGIVAWRARLDQPSCHAENVEVYASHSGIGNHPAALWVFADRLTQAPGKWAPFRPPAQWRCAYPTPDRDRPGGPVMNMRAATSACR